MAIYIFEAWTFHGFKKYHMYNWKNNDLLYIRSYNPVEGDLKSGMPADVEIPAPHMTITFL